MFGVREGCANGQNCTFEHERLSVAQGQKASERTRTKKPKSEQSSPNGNKGSRRDSPNKGNGNGTNSTLNPSVRRMEIPPMPGSGSTSQEPKEEERSVNQEPDPESFMNVTLKRLMRNPNMTSGGKELLSNLPNLTNKVDSKD